MAIWLTGQREEEKQRSEEGSAGRWQACLSVCLPEHSSIILCRACLCILISLWCVSVCLSVCGPNEGCLQYNERCGQIMEEVITPVCSSSRLLRITLLIGQMQQHDRPGRDAKMEKGEKSTPKINSSSLWLPIKAEEWGTQVSGECVCAHTNTNTNTNTNTLQLSSSPQQVTSAVCVCVVIQTVPLSREICRLQLSLVKC